MSCFIVNELHIDLLVDVAFHGPCDSRPVCPDNAWRSFYWSAGPVETMAQLQESHYELDSAAAPGEFPRRLCEDDLGRLLVQANYESYQARYPDHSAYVEVSDYRWVRRPYQLSTVEALKAVACLIYQSCEHPDWKGSVAEEFLRALRLRLIDVLPGMESAPWEWTPEALAAAVVAA